MGNCKSGCSATDLSWAPSRDVTVALLGLDNSGKSTLLANLAGDSTEGLTPTIGFVNSNLDIGNYDVTLYDLGGGPRVRNIWKNYYPEIHGLIFVVDSGSVDRLVEAKEVFSTIMQHEKIKGKPLLIFANKQDLDEAIDDNAVAQHLDLDTLLGDNRDNSSVVKCIALKSATQNRPDPSIKRGVKWLLNSIGKQYDSIAERVRVDVTEQRLIEAQQRRERAERVRKIREERERQKALRGEADDEEVDNGAPANPFRPITEVAREAEERERIAKAAKKAKQENEAALESSPKASTAVVSVAESTSHEAVDLTDSRLDGEPCQPAAESDAGASAVPRAASQGSLRSHASSGLSESSDTLTDVTPRSHGSSDSLHLSASVNSSGQQSTRSHHGVRLEPLRPEMVEKTKKKNRKMLLSRLKNRNKTAPSLIEDNHTNKKEFHLVSRNTWTSAELETVAAPPDTPELKDGTHNPSLSLEQRQRDIVSSLPDVPPSKGIKLPPIKLSSSPVGLQGGTVTSEQDVATLPQNSIMVLPQPPLLSTEAITA